MIQVNTTIRALKNESQRESAELGLLLSESPSRKYRLQKAEAEQRSKNLMNNAEQFLDEAQPKV